MEKYSAIWWKEAEEFTKETLDKIDILEIIKSNNIKNISKLIDELDNKYQDSDITNNDFMSGDLLNCYSVSEFEDYLSKRYKKELRLEYITTTNIKLI